MQPIGIFDSGVGGLGILKAVAALLPAQDIVYVADNANFPFGQKTPEQLQQITAKIVRFLVGQHHAKLIIIACNTASVSSLDYLRKHFSVPIVGVVPVVKPACEQSTVKKIAILATTATAQSLYQQDLIKKYGSGVQVFAIACPGLVTQVEAGDFDSDVTKQLLQTYLQPALDAGVDVIGLSCTHFPFLIDQIKKLVSPAVVIIDSNEAVARHAVRVLQQKKEALQSTRGRYQLFVTKEPERFQKVAQRLVGDMAHDVRHIAF